MAAIPVSFGEILAAALAEHFPAPSPLSHDDTTVVTALLSETISLLRSSLEVSSPELTRDLVVFALGKADEALELLEA